jgi:renalase
MKPHVLVIGAGMAGATCARELADLGYRVTVVDKGRGPGGRMATRRYDHARFDHGAPGFSARQPAFRALVERWQADGLVAQWAPLASCTPGCHADNQFVGKPSMNRLTQQPLEGLSVRFGTTVRRLESMSHGIRVEFDANAPREVFDAVVMTIPAPQALAMLKGWKGFEAPLETVRMRPRWVSMVSFSRPLACTEQALAWGDEDPILHSAWRDSTKPGREQGEHWVLHGSAPFTEQFLEISADSAAERLVTAFGHRLGETLPSTIMNVGHRWRYATTATPLGQPCLTVPGVPLVLAGDWCLGTCVEDAWTSGLAAAHTVRLTFEKAA